MLALDDNLIDLVDHDRDLHFDDLWYINVDYFFVLDCLAKLLSVGDFGLRNQTLELSYFADDGVLLSFERLGVVQALLYT